MNMNWFGKCRQYQESLSLMALDCLQEPEKAKLQQHLARCQHCQQEFARLRETARGFSTWTSATIEPSAASHFRLMQALRAAEGQPQSPVGAASGMFTWKRAGWCALGFVWAMVLFFNLDAPKTTALTQRSQPVSPSAALAVLRSKQNDVLFGSGARQPQPVSPLQPPHSRRFDQPQTMLDS